MNRTRLSALAALAATLALGVALGFVAAGTVREARRPPLPRPEGRPGGGFPDVMRDVIRPTDDAQCTALLPAITATDARNRASVQAAQDSLAAHLEEMTRQLDTLLTPEQRARLADAARGLRAGTAPAPGLGRGAPNGPPPGGPPPDGRGGPPPPR